MAARDLVWKGGKETSTAADGNRPIEEIAKALDGNPGPEHRCRRLDGNRVKGTMECGLERSGPTPFLGLNRAVDPRAENVARLHFRPPTAPPAAPATDPRRIGSLDRR